MFLRKFYNAEEGAGGAAVMDAPTLIQLPPQDETIVVPVQHQTTVEPIVEKQASSFSPEQLKSWGFESIDQLDAFVKTQKATQRPAEEIQKEQDIENARFRAFAIEEGQMTENDFKSYEKLMATADKDLVFQDYFNEFKAENPDIAEEELLTAAQDQFDAEYKTASAKRIAKEATDIRKEITSKFSSAKENYSVDNKFKAASEPYKAFITKTLNEALTDKIVFQEGKDGEDDITVSVEVTAAERAEIAKKVLGNKQFVHFVNGDKERLANDLKERIQNFALAKYAKQAVSNAYKLGAEISEKRIKIGANNPFAMIDRRGGTQTEGTANEETIQQSHAKASSFYPKY